MTGLSDNTLSKCLREEIPKASRLDSKRTRGIFHCPTVKNVTLFNNGLLNNAQYRLFSGIVVIFVKYHGQMDMQVCAHNLRYWYYDNFVSLRSALPCPHELSYQHLRASFLIIYILQVSTLMNAFYVNLT